MNKHYRNRYYTLVLCFSELSITFQFIEAKVVLNSSLTKLDVLVLQKTLIGKLSEKLSVLDGQMKENERLIKR